MKIILDLDRCMGHGQCELFAPNVFQIGEEDVVEQLRDVDENDPVDVEAVRTAAQNCPERVITLIEDDNA